MTNIFGSILSSDFSITTYLVCLGCAFLCGLMAAFASRFRASVSKSFVVALVLLPAIVNTVIMMVNGNVGTGIAVAGAFSLVRFRSAAGKAKDIACIFLAMTAGLACAAGYVVLAVLFTAVICLVMVIVVKVPMSDDRDMDLRITVPESLQYSEAFNDLFSQYTKRNRLVRVKTSNMGSLYKLLYKIEMKDSSKTQEFIDRLRCRNGNLEIAISEKLEEDGEL